MDRRAKKVGKVIKITTFQSVKRGNWTLRYSCTDMGSIMLLARSLLAPENSFIKYFHDEEVAASFGDFLTKNDFYDPDPYDPGLSA